MKSIILFSVLFCFLASCSNSKIAVISNQNFQICNKENAVNISDSAIRKKGYRLETLNKEITENDTLFLIYYYPKNSNLRGGDADVKISKKTCEILEIMRYQ